MKRVPAFVGSAHRKNTHNAVVQFLNNIQALGRVECDIVTLSDYRLEIYRGCRLCFERGEEFCPLTDARDVLRDKLMVSDGVVFASPNYLFQVSGLMKVFIDRLGFVGHRPCYFGKTFTTIVTQGIMRGDKIVEYLDFVAGSLGFNTVKGACVTALDPRTEKDQRKIDWALAELSQRYYARLARPAYPKPTLFTLMMFRMARTNISQKLDDTSRDYRYFAEKGWFDSDYYYPTRLSVPQKLAGNLFDAMAPTIMGMFS